MAKTLADFAMDLGFEADGRGIILPYGRFRESEYGFLLEREPAAYLRERNRMKSYCPKEHMFFEIGKMSSEDRKRELVMACYFGEPADLDFIGLLHLGLSHIMPDHQELLEENVHKLLDGLETARGSDAPWSGLEELRLARELAAYASCFGRVSVPLSKTAGVHIAIGALSGSNWRDQGKISRIKDFTGLREIEE